MEIRPLTEAHGNAIATWRYPDRYSTYDVGEIMTPADGYWAVVAEGELVGCCCFGVEARVPGVDEEEGTLDVGYGMRPDLVGKGFGRAFVTAIVGNGVTPPSPRTPDADEAVLKLMLDESSLPGRFVSPNDGVPVRAESRQLP